MQAVFQMALVLTTGLWLLLNKKTNPIKIKKQWQFDILSTLTILYFFTNFNLIPEMAGPFYIIVPLSFLTIFASLSFFYSNFEVPTRKIRHNMFWALILVPMWLTEIVKHFGNQIPIKVYAITELAMLGVMALFFVLLCYFALMTTIALILGAIQAFITDKKIITTTINIIVAYTDTTTSPYNPTYFSAHIQLPESENKIISQFKTRMLNLNKNLANNKNATIEIVNELKNLKAQADIDNQSKSDITQLIMIIKSQKDPRISFIN